MDEAQDFRPEAPLIYPSDFPKQPAARQFEAILLKGMTNRYVIIETSDYRAAYKAAEEMCEPGEFCRGVNELGEEVAATQEP